MSQIAEHELTPAEQAVPPWAADKTLTPIDVALREVATLGLAKACFKWAGIASSQLENHRWLAVVRTLISIAYRTGPPMGMDPVYVVTVYDASDTRKWDAIISDAPNGVIAAAAAGAQAMLNDVIPIGQLRFDIAKADGFHSVDIRRRTTSAEGGLVSGVVRFDLDEDA